MRDDPESTGFVMDHITPISEGGSPRDLDNLGLLCDPCDARKSAAEAARGNARRRARTARPEASFERLWLNEKSRSTGPDGPKSPPRGEGESRFPA